MSDIQLRPTALLIEEAVLGDNVLSLRRRLQHKARMMAVVKANAYGHGLVQTARVVLSCGADALGVATCEEGIALREARIQAPILVMGGLCEQEAEACVLHQLSMALYDIGILQAMQRVAAKLDTVAHAHLKIDTGMARLGVRGENELEQMLSAMKDCPNVKMEGIFTHFAAAYDDPEYTREQNAKFLQAIARVRAEGYRPTAHAAASEAMLMDETLWHGMVRPGIAMYGASVRHLCPDLVPAQKLVTKPVRIEQISAGDTVGYGREFTAQRETLVMTLPIGYGDGYPRLLGNRAAVLVKGQRAPVIGRVCMDMMMVDVTDIPGVTRADEVVLLGKQGDARITPDELAMLAGTIPYEIMLGFTARVPMVYV
ncbi:alanine racemase [Eubacteriales bacterium OttesenSCG-928-N13]|nr:alanine racemase [Eubacteriales bacterium OttesenSCG-928-N13]